MALPKLYKLTRLSPQPSKLPAPAASNLPSTAPAARPPLRMLSPDPAARAEPVLLENALATVPPQRTLSHPARPAPADLVPQEILVIFAAFFRANYFGKGFSKVLGFFVTEPRVAEPVRPLEPGKIEESGKKKRLETIEEVDEEEGSDEVERPDVVENPPAPALIQPQQGGGGHRGKKTKNKKNKKKAKR
ncbi:hypothetical protein Landi51_02054 [Colletotrichum acutatum]